MRGLFIQNRRALQAAHPGRADEILRAADRYAERRGLLAVDTAGEDDPKRVQQAALDAGGGAGSIALLGGEDIVPMREIDAGGDTIHTDAFYAPQPETPVARLLGNRRRAPQPAPPDRGGRAESRDPLLLKTRASTLKRSGFSTSSPKTGTAPMSSGGRSAAPQTISTRTT